MRLIAPRQHPGREYAQARPPRANAGRSMRDRCPRYAPRHAAPCPPSDDHYRHDEPSTRLDYYVVLSGGLEVGGFHGIGSGPSKGCWSWGTKICTDDTTYTAGAAYPDVCCTMIGGHAVIGLSRPRCGLYVVDIDEHTIDQLYDVAVLPGVRQAEAVDFVRVPPALDSIEG
jgi:hypothetical protein